MVFTCEFTHPHAISHTSWWCPADCSLPLLCGLLWPALSYSALAGEMDSLPQDTQCKYFRVVALVLEVCDQAYNFIVKCSLSSSLSWLTATCWHCYCLPANSHQFQWLRAWTFFPCSRMLPPLPNGTMKTCPMTVSLLRMPPSWPMQRGGLWWLIPSYKASSGSRLERGVSWRWYDLDRRGKDH